ncbi:B12-binding domain-containing radical SAM protein [Azonexus sp.]|uniref:B12-binding domain-containing radical SAM protein n=1 Tax=Azonexus sp. TaxID=1872668 RepID=UPI0039E316FA
MLPERPAILSIIPPMTQLNIPYPATAYLTGFLRARGFPARQADLAIHLVLDLLAPEGLDALHEAAEALPRKRRSASLKFFLNEFPRYRYATGPTLAFLQGRDPSLAQRIVSRSFLPEGPRFSALEHYLDDDSGDPLNWAFGALGLQDRARHFATLFINDLADIIREAGDARFEFIRYGESLAQSQGSFAPLAAALAAPPSLVDRFLERRLFATLQENPPQIALFSVPFPGSVYAAFRMAQSIKAQHPEIVTVLGGGWVNTELRELAEARVFDFFDYVTLDDGEKPLLALIEHLSGSRPREQLVRTYVRDVGSVRYIHSGEADIPFSEIGTPTWEGLPLDRYLSLLDLLNPMHRLWSDGRWNKLTVAHGCYWKKCSFCDISLDYISRFDAISAAQLVDRMEQVIDETGYSGFHFVDEAAPPKALRAMAAELKTRGRVISWWGNIRFEKSFTPELCHELAASGCIAVSGGLEVASDRLLGLMQKGVSVDQVARVTRAFSDAGILVHAYLMYGFPTQTVQDTVDALEYVRQLFAEGCIQSGFFHRFSCTVHSPVGKNPAQFGITLQPAPFAGFAKNDVAFNDPSGVDHDTLGRALNKALYNYMHGICLEDDVRRWFDERVPRPRVKRDFIARALAAQ